MTRLTLTSPLKMRCLFFSDEMREEWQHGMSEYDGGNMDAAESHFLRVLALSADSDVPSKKMLERIGAKTQERVEGGSSPR